MKQLFLTSEINLVAKDIASKIKTSSGNLRTAFVTTPVEKESGDLGWHEENKGSMLKAGFDFFEYTITGKTSDEISKDLADIDVLYVEGGSLVHMMNEARKSGFDDFVGDFVEKGGVYIGTSTGSFIAAEDTAPGLVLEGYLEDDFDPAGIGLVNFLVMPHWGSKDSADEYKKLADHAYSMTTPMVILTNTQYVWVKGQDFQIITT